MADSHSPQSRSPEPEVELSRLTGPARRRGGWRLAALVVGVLLAGVIVAGRWGLDSAPPVASPSPSAVALTPRPSVSAPPSEAPSASPRASLPPISDAAPAVVRFLDGIPASLDGQKVYRVDSALARAGDRLVLVGGWYSGPACVRDGRCSARLADSPSAAARGDGVPVGGLIASGSGPRIFRARVLERCNGVGSRTVCEPVLSTVGDAWSGDFATQTSPIEAQPLLSALAVGFPEMHAAPFRDGSSCLVPWPPQSYRSTTGGPRMTLIFPTIEDRLAAQGAIELGWPKPADELSGACVDQFMPITELAAWLVAENAMLWVTDDQRALAEAALVDARNLSAADRPIVSRPLSTWTALLGLRRWDADIDILPESNAFIWAPIGLPADGTYVLSHPALRVLLVFPTAAERRAYQQSSSARDVVVTSLQADEPEILRQLGELRAGGVRWLGYRNVLLQVNGPAQIDDELRAALRGEVR